MIDENEFFRQATLRICGDLEIEQAMSALLGYLSQVMPADRMFLQLFDQGLGAMRTIAHSTQKESRKVDLLTPLSSEVRAAIERVEGAPSRAVIIFEHPEEIPVSREMLHFHNVTATSLMVMMLTSGKHILGSVVLITDGEGGYNEEHARLFALLKDPFMVAMSNALQHHELTLLKDMLADDNRFLQGELRRMSGEDIIGANFGLQQVMEEVRKVAVLDTPVLLLGETGVGKEVIANTIHASSPRRDGPFVKVNCGAIPESLIDSELFGHEKGSFTGALSQKRGRFERANTGTVFLDEIGELPLPAQVRLLRVLQEKEIERVGGTKTIAVDCRVIAATHRNLEEMAKAGQFREDLWFRISVFPMTIPPLRERRSDIPALLQYCIREKVKDLKLPVVPDVAPGVIDRFLEYAWPGNVRELANVVEREIILNPHGPLTFGHVNPVLQTKTPDKEEQRETTDNLDEVSRQHIQRVLDKTQGKVHGPGGAAELLGINANTLRNRMNKLGITYGGKRKFT